MNEILNILYGPLSEQLGVAVPVILTAVMIVSIWDAVWKIIGMWKAARNNSLAWFICIAIFNTVGILPILYIYVFSKRKKSKRK